MAIFRKLAERRTGAISEVCGFEVPAADRGSVFEAFFAARDEIRPSAKETFRARSRAVLSPRRHNARSTHYKASRRWPRPGR